MESKEVKPVKGYENIYTISSCGEVRNIKTGRILKPQDNGIGYLQVHLHKEGKCERKLVHRLILEAFKEQPEGKNYCNHIDGDKKNNRLENLEWVTFRENIFHYWNSPASDKRRKPVIAFSRDHTRALIFQSVREAERNGFDQSAISNCCNGKLPHHKGYYWSFIKNNSNQANQAALCNAYWDV